MVSSSFFLSMHSVISYVGEADRDLAEEVKEVVGDRSKNFNAIFSRNKMLRRKINRKKQHLLRTVSCDQSEQCHVTTLNNVM